MAILEAYSLDQLNRLLTFSKWMLIVCGIIFVIFLVLNQWLASRVSALQDEENQQTQQALQNYLGQESFNKLQRNGVIQFNQ